MASSNPATPDSSPTEVNIGVINPFALVEAIVGRRLDPTSPDTARVISDVLQTEYAELFDMRYCSVLFAGLKLNEREKKAERMGRHELRILTDEDMVTPDMSRIKKLGDLEHVGLKDILELQVQDAHIRSGKVRLALYPHMLGRTLSNSAVTEPLCEISTPFRPRKGREGEWVPPNCSWQDMAELSQQIQRMRLVIGEMGIGLDASGVSDVERAFAIRLGRQQIEQLQRPKGMSSDPIQGAIANSWLVAALFSVAWAEPYRIVRDHGLSVKPTDKSKKHTLVIRLYSKGGENDGPTSNIEVDSEIPINNCSGLPIYCQPSSRIGTLWPSLYEKAFAKWLTKDSSGHTDITRTSAVANGGDPVKAMAQINDGKPQYFFTKSRTATDLIGLVRTNSINFKTIHPMVAYTHATGSSSAAYNGCSMVANHAYSVLGWAPTPAGGSGNQYIVLRNPWGITEPAGLTTYTGLIQPVDADTWSPANMVDLEGVFALDANAFKEYFACLGMAKLKTKNDE